ncbi:MAG: NACHT domain-containing protein [Phototrophicaceae bacterium]
MMTSLSEIPKSNISATDNVKSQPTKIKSLATWRDAIKENWQTLKTESENTKLASVYHQLVYIALKPILPSNKSDLKQLINILQKTPYCQALATLIKTIYEHESFSIDVKQLIEQNLNRIDLSQDEQLGLDWIIATTGVLAGFEIKSPTTKKFMQHLQDDLLDIEGTSPVRVQARMVSAGQNVIFAGRDVHFMQQSYQGDKVALYSYLSKVRTEWNMPATNIHPRADIQSHFSLHELYTPPDVWSNMTEYSKVSKNQLTELRFDAIEKDHKDARRPVLEAVAENPYIVITGGAGTGKSSLCHFILTALAYACDPNAEKNEGVDGLKLLGPAWVHHEFLPIYVSLRDFANHSKIFPKTLKTAKAQSLLTYIKTHEDDFGEYIEAFLTQTNVKTHGTLLILDGLDEVYDEKHRVILRQIIENWADRFKSCRILLTSRTYAYRHDAAWRLSERFKSVELAPFTWRQIKFYVQYWYQAASQSRPSTFGGAKVASQQAKVMANDLIKSIIENKSIWPLARQPLLLALLTLIHEDYKHLPSKRADLYENTVDLLDRWNIPSSADTLHEKLAGLNLEGMRAALKHIAFDLQSQQKSFEKYPSIIERSQLLDKLMTQQLYGEGLGAKIEDVLDYLATRNGIVVSDMLGYYRFPHLSFQEYLAACALIEFYDECPMPEHLQQPHKDGWQFPENIVALLRDEPFRWRQVAIFTGSIIAADKGQDLRWQLISELLPETLGETISEADLHSIAIAAEIWSESWLKPRKRLHKTVQNQLKKYLTAIESDERLDAPERIKTIEVLAKLSTDVEDY